MAEPLLTQAPSLRGYRNVTGMQKRELSGKSHRERVVVTSPVKRQLETSWFFLLILPPSQLLGME